MGRLAIKTLERACALEIEARAVSPRKVMRGIEGQPELSQREIARGLGVSLGGVNCAIQVLVQRSFIDADNLQSRVQTSHTCPRLHYEATPNKVSLATVFLDRKL